MACPICEVFPCSCALIDGVIVPGGSNGKKEDYRGKRKIQGESPTRKNRSSNRASPAKSNETDTGRARDWHTPGEDRKSLREADVSPLLLTIQERSAPINVRPKRITGKGEDGHLVDCDKAARGMMLDETGYCAWCDDYFPIPKPINDYSDVESEDDDE